jgi:phospholipid/cholesterol/gamma-HCH transport system substrate-binding protein
VITRKHRAQLLAFVVVAVVSVVHVGVNYAGLGHPLGARGYVVTAQLADSGGIFTGAEVSYRGVAVGTVGPMRLSERGVDVSLDIDSGAPGIPADTAAVVATRSAVGEQYVDLRPQHADGPLLRDGSVIPTARTSIPVSPDTVLGNLDKLVSGIHPPSLRTVVDETYDAFAGAGPDLRTLLDTAGSFTAAATENLPQTRALLADGRVVLGTERRQSGSLLAFSAGLRTLAGRLKASDPELRKVIDDAPKLATQVSDVLATAGPDLGIVLANLLTTAQITSARTDAVEELLVAYPVISAFAPTTSPDGTGHLGVVLNLFDPPSCTKGYEGTRQRAADDLTETPVNLGAYCAEPPGSPTGVRGAQNAPYGGRAAGVPAQPPQWRPGGPAAPEQALPGLLGDTAARGGVGPSSIGQLLGLPR